MLSPAAFLDRDGVLNVDTGYPHRPEDLQLVPGAVEAVAWLRAQGFKAVVVSNQSGVARGMFAEADVESFNAALLERFEAARAPLDAIYFCPFHPEGTVAAYRRDHPDRKPSPGMIERAIVDLGIERSSSFLIGDKASDVAAAHAARMPGFLFETGNLLDFVLSLPLDPPSDCGCR